MRKIVLVLFGLVFSFSFIFASGSKQSRITGNGNIVSINHSVSSFETLQINIRASVRYHISPEYHVDIHVDSNISEYVIIESINNILKIEIPRNSIRSYRPTEFFIDIYGPLVKSISLSGSVMFELMDRINVPSFSILMSGSCTLVGMVDSDNFTAVVSGSGAINLAGQSNDMNIKISGTGSFSGEQYVANNVDIIISGSGNIENIGIIEYLSVNISGSGKINYRGSPRIYSSVSGSGKINKIENTV